MSQVCCKSFHMLGCSIDVPGFGSGPSKWSEALGIFVCLGIFPCFCKEVNPFSFIAFKVKLFFQLFGV